MKELELHFAEKNPFDSRDLLDSSGKFYATVYTERNAREDNLRPGITKSEDGFYDIVISAGKLTKENVQSALDELSGLTNIKYRLR